MKMRTNSLAFRFLLISALWSVFALVVTAFLLTSIYKGNAERNFNELLTAHLYNLMGAIDIDDQGILTGTPNLGDPLFQQPYSGWYWSVMSQSAENAPSRILRSTSMVASSLRTPESTDIPFKGGFLRTYQIPGFQNEQLVAVEAQIFLGEGDDVFRFMVAGNYNAITDEIGEFSRSLIVFLALFGLGMVASTFVVIKLGLRPLNRAKHALNEVRNGDADRLEGKFPEEITPLVDEMNALIDTNKSVLERARTQVGNLAHALKTPISVLKNEVRSPGKDLSKKVSEQADRLQEHVQRYLDRARIAAQSGSIKANTPVGPVIDRMLRVMQRLNPNISFEHLTDNQNKFSFRGEQQDLEEVLGNLLENAGKYATTKVVVSIALSSTETNPMLKISIEDDGQGLSETQRKEAIERGRRLDESRPGSGLGLSIVNDIVSEYHGSISLKDSGLGGLQVVVQLPASIR